MKLSNKNYLTYKIDEDGEKIYHIKTPCKFIIKEDVVEYLKKEYTSTEEIGGIIWVKPIEEEGELRFIGDKISFIRNSIEDYPNERERTKKNTYKADKNEYKKVLKEVFNSNYLPISFHSHPTKGKQFLDEFLNFSYQRETSKQDIRASYNPIIIGKDKLLMPHGLVVGNDKLGDKIFIGLYNGFIAPTGFEETKEQVIEENINEVADKLFQTKLNKNQKIALTIGALLLLAVIIKYKKYSIPAIMTMGIMLPLQLSDTNKSPKYYNQLSNGDAVIEVPDYENEPTTTYKNNKGKFLD